MLHLLCSCARLQAAPSACASAAPACRYLERLDKEPLKTKVRRALCSPAPAPARPAAAGAQARRRAGHHRGRPGRPERPGGPEAGRQPGTSELAAHGRDGRLRRAVEWPQHALLAAVCRARLPRRPGPGAALEEGAPASPRLRARCRALRAAPRGAGPVTRSGPPGARTHGRLRAGRAGPAHLRRALLARACPLACVTRVASAERRRRRSRRPGVQHFHDDLHLAAC